MKEPVASIGDYRNADMPVQFPTTQSVPDLEFPIALSVDSVKTHGQFH